MRQIALDSVMITVILSAIPMIAIALSAGLVALIQAATQIQEQSVTHLVRLVTFIAVVAVCGDWAGGEILSLFERSLRALESVGRGPP